MRRGICPARNRKGRSQMTTESQLKGWLEADSVSTSTGGPSLIPPSWRDVEACRAMMLRLHQKSLEGPFPEILEARRMCRAGTYPKAPSAPTIKPETPSK